MFWFFPRVDKQWLLGEVEASRSMIKRLSGSGGNDEPWRQQAETALRQTENSIRKNELQRAWLTLKEARRSCIPAMGDEERRARAIELRNEAGKIDSQWRADAIREILSVSPMFPADGDVQALADLASEDDAELQAIALAKFRKNWKSRPIDLAVNAEHLVCAEAIRDQHYDNLWRKIDRRRSAITTSVFMLVIFTAAIVLLWNVPCLHNWFEIEVKKGQEISLLLIALFGALGASLSSAYTLATSDLPDKFTQGAMSIRVTATRPSIGAAAGIASLFIYAGGLMDGIVAEDMFTENVILAVAFTSGFSERLIFSATKKIADKASGAKR